MDDFLYYNELYTFYNELLTDREREYFSNYYLENLSLNEIALNFKVSKQAVSLMLNNIRIKLDNYEEILKLKKRDDFMKKILSPDTYEEYKKL